MKKNSTIQEDFAVAMENHKKNNLDVAEKLYINILEKEKNNS